MTELPHDSSRPHCQAGRGCDRAPCFQARLDATAGQYRVHKRTDLCAEHLGAAIQAITAWARDEGLRGEVTVLAIDLSGSGAVTPAWDISSLAFATIPITPFTASGGQSCPRVYPPMNTSKADTNEDTGGTSQEDGPPSRSAPWPNALSPVSMADRARSARLNWASARPARQQYREVRTLGEHHAAAVPARSATPPRTCHAI
jgi:hypothetical protein